MSKLKNVVFALVALLAFMVTPAFADKENEGCKTGKFVGSYTLALPNQDVFGNGSVLHTYLFQLNLHSDGTASQFNTAAPDFMINTGSTSPAIGSWTCRRDGKLVVTLIFGLYDPTGPTPNTTYADIQLSAHFRSTYLFSVEDNNTLTRISRRNRVYTANQDPSDPNGGTLGHLSSAVFVWKRLVASDADLLAP